MIETSTKIIPRLQIIRDRAIAKGEAQGEARGEARGLARGEARGLAKGMALGEARGEAKALLKFLDVRGLVLTAAQREQILSCSDAKRLETWIERAATARTAVEVLRAPARRTAPRAPA